MKTLVIAGTGTVGSQIVSRLAERGSEVVVMTREVEKQAALASGVEGLVANLADPPSLQKVFAGVDSVVLIVPVHPDETKHGEFAVRAAKKAGVKKIVYMSVFMPPGSNLIPHFASKIPVEQAIKQSGMAYTILRPNNFFQNDLALRDAILTYGVYPQPIGLIGVNRVDVRDIADLAVLSLTEPRHERKTYNVHGPDKLTGKDVARIYGRHVGSEVNYFGDDLESWAEQVQQILPAWMVHDFRIMYKYFQDQGMPAAEADLVELQKALGRPLRKFDDFVSETVTLWKEQARESKRESSH